MIGERKICGLADKCSDNGVIDPALFIQHKVNKGLRDPKGKGVLTGLTNISDVIAKKSSTAKKYRAKASSFTEDIISTNCATISFIATDTVLKR